MNKKESCITKRPGIYFVARNHCEQDKILLSKEESLNEDTHIRENNDNVSICILFQIDTNFLTN
jgi:hypothetical protein